MKIIRCCDLFAGAGGTSTGFVLACASRGLRHDLTAVNHWDVAVQTHAANHPGARHVCESLDGIDPRKLFPGGKIDVLLASPECTHHSRARGGKPCSDQSRSTAWHVVRWADALRPDFVIVENVREFAEWGPLGEKGQPLKSRKGETFRAWADAIRSLNYSVGWRALNAADYGAATTRQRLFVVAARGRRPVPWPEPTHARSPQPGLFGTLKPWRAAREVIDWTTKGKSIFGRKTPLKENTLNRIRAGLERFGGKNAEPFLALLTHHGGDRVRSIDAPLPTITGANRGEIALVEPFVIGQQSGAVPRAVADPLPTVAGAGAISLVEPFLVAYYGQGENADSVADPVRTLTAKDRLGLVQPTRALDILFRMLLPHELSAAMSFPPGYAFKGNRSQVTKMIGNAVDVNQAFALCDAALGGVAA